LVLGFEAEAEAVEEGSTIIIKIGASEGLVAGVMMAAIARG
jgi:hypothetical protein